MSLSTPRIVAICLALAFVSGMVGCGGPPPVPRTRDDVFRDMQNLEKLYLTEDGKRVIATSMQRTLIDEESGKIAWEAYQCDNPACPGRDDEQPHLFPWVDSFAYIENGVIMTRQPSSPEDEKKMSEYGEQKCPACLKERKIEGESEQQRQQYKDWCQLHVLPESAIKIKELEEERRAIMQLEQKQAEQRKKNRQ